MYTFEAFGSEATFGIEPNSLRYERSASPCTLSGQIGSDERG